MQTKISQNCTIQQISKININQKLIAIILHLYVVKIKSIIGYFIPINLYLIKLLIIII